MLFGSSILAVNWLLFAIGAPLGWSIGNITDSAVRRNFVHSDYALTWFLAMTRLPFIIAFLLIGIYIPSLDIFLLMAASGFLWVLPFILYFKALEFEEPTKIALMLQLTPVFTLPIAFFIIGEKLTLFQAVSFFLLFAGGIVASIKRYKNSWHLGKAIILMIGASFLWALSDVLFKKYALFFPNFLSAFAVYYIGGFIPAAFFLLFKRTRNLTLDKFRGLPLRAWGFLIIGQLFGLSGTVSFAYALTLGKASLTSVFMGFQPIFAFAIGLIFSKFLNEIYKEETGKLTLLLKGASFLLIASGLVFLQY